MPVWGALVSLSIGFLFGVARQWAYRVVCNRGALVLTMYLFTVMAYMHAVWVLTGFSCETQVRLGFHFRSLPCSSFTLLSYGARGSPAVQC